MKRIKVIILLLVLVATPFVFSQNWTHHSSFPKTGSIIDLSVGQAGNVYLLTSDRQIYRSADNGSTWTAFIQTPLWLNVLEIKASKISNRVFVKTNCCGVAYTDNLGASWAWDNLLTSSSGLGLSPRGIGAFQSKVVAITERFDGGFVRELYSSTSNGANSTWSLIHTFSGNFSSKDVFLLDNNLMFASSALLSGFPPNTVTLRKSTNGGVSFTDVPFFTGRNVIDLLMTPTPTIYCATNTTTTGEIHVSNDLGDTWTTITPPTSASKIIQITFDAVNDVLYSLTEDGIYRKTGSGNWENISVQGNLVTLEISNSQDVLTGGLVVIGVLKSAPSPISFSTIEIGGSYSPEWLQVSGTTILAGNRNNPMISKENINTPNTWQHTAIQNISLSSEAVGFGATIGSFAAGVKNNGDLIISGNNYIVNMDVNLNFNIIADESTGAPLAPISNPSFIPQTLKLSNNDEILLNQLNADYIDLSLNGSTWSVLNPVTSEPTKLMLNFCASTTRYYVSTNDFSQVYGDEVFYSSDGVVWNSIPLPTTTTEKGIFIDRNDNLYLLGTNPLSLYRLDISNQQWITTNLNLHNDPNTYFELVFDSNNRMYALNYRATSAASTSQGIAYSDDQGVSWTEIGFPIENGNTIFLESMGFDENDLLYAKTSNSNNNVPATTKGIYYFGEGLSVSELDVTSITIYPNPVSDFFNVKTKANGTYFIHNLIGERIYSGRITTGDNTIQFPENATKGVYIFSVKTTESTLSQKIIFNNK